MGSVTSYEECPVCHGENCFVDSYYKTGEEYRFCSDCGYHFSAEIINRTKKLNELTESDWEISECLTPYAAYRARDKQSKGQIAGCFTTKEQCEEILKHINEDIDELTISRYIDGKIVVVDMMRLYKLKKISKKLLYGRKTL